MRGVDAYYYAVQADSLVKSGGLLIPDSSVVHYIVAAFAMPGLGIENALRLWAADSVTLFCLSFYAVFRKRRTSWPALLCLAWPLLSPSLLFCALEFPKTFSFMIVMNFWFLCAEPETLPPKRLPFLLLLVAAACALHKMAIAYGAVFLFALAARFFCRRAGAGLKRGVALCLAACAIFAGLFFLLPDFLHLKDVFRLREARFMPGAIALVMEQNLPTAIKAEFALAVLALLCLVWKMRRRPLLLMLALSPVVPAFIPAFGSEPFSLGERFGLLFPYGVALGGALYVARAAKDKEPPFNAPAAFCIVLAVLGLSWQRLHFAHPDNINPPYGRYAEISSELEKREIPMLIAHRGIHYYYKFRTGRMAFSYEPEAHWPPEKTWRLIFGVSGEELFYYLPAECGWQSDFVRSLGNTKYNLVREDCYRKFRAAVSEEMNPELYGLLWRTEINPSRPRPAFLYKKHESRERGEFSALP